MSSTMWRNLRASGDDGTLTAEDVEQVTFQVTKLREGYDRREVDDFLVWIAATLRYDPHCRAVTAHDVLTMKFSLTKFREGYDQEDVDNFLDKVISTLRRLAEG